MSNDCQDANSCQTKDSQLIGICLENEPNLSKKETGQNAHEASQLPTTDDIRKGECRNKNEVTDMKHVRREHDTGNTDTLLSETSGYKRHDKLEGKLTAINNDDEKKDRLMGTVEHQVCRKGSKATSSHQRGPSCDRVEEGVIMNIRDQKRKMKTNPVTSNHTRRQRERVGTTEINDNLPTNNKPRYTYNNDGHFETGQASANVNHVRRCVKQTPVMKKSHSTGELGTSSPYPEKGSSDSCRKTHVHSDIVALPLITDDVAEYSFDQHPRGYRRVNSLAPALESKPPSYMWLALFTIFFNFIIGLIALVIAMQSDHEYWKENIPKARKLGRVVKILCLVAISTTSLAILIVTVVFGSHEE